MTHRGEIISTTYDNGCWHGERTVTYPTGAVNTAWYNTGKKAKQEEIEMLQRELSNKINGQQLVLANQQEVITPLDMTVTPNQLEHLGSFAAGTIDLGAIEQDRKRREHPEATLYDPRKSTMPNPDDIFSSPAQVHNPVSAGPPLSEK